MKECISFVILEDTIVFVSLFKITNTCFPGFFFRQIDYNFQLSGYILGFAVGPF